MKRFSQTVVQIKNADGEFEPIAALRGLSSYELAVQNGFEGTEDEWLETMLSDGWVGKYQELEAKKANRSEVYTSEQTDELLIGFDKSTKEYVSLCSYLAFAGNVNEDMTNAALGMNNEENVFGVGKALAMYARFKDPTLTLKLAFPNLLTCDKLSDFTSDAILELNNSDALRELFTKNSYAFNNAIIPNAKSVIYTPDNYQNITFTNMDSSSMEFAAEYRADGLHPYYTGYSGGNELYTLNSVESFSTNGAAYLCFYVADMNDNEEFGVVGDTGDIITPTLTEGAWCSIDVSGFSSIKLYAKAKRVTLNEEYTEYLTINNILLTDFLVDA